MQNKFDFTNSKILVVGDTLLDTYWHGNIERISPEAPVPVSHFTKTDNRLAGAGLIASIIKSLNARVDLICCLGKDNESDKTLELLKASNINIDHILLADIKTKQRIRIVSQAKQLLRIDSVDQENTSEPSSCGLTAGSSINKLFNQIFKDYSIVIFYQHSNSNSIISNDNLKRWQEICSQNNIKAIYLSEQSDNINYLDNIINTQSHNQEVEDTIGLKEMYAAVLSLGLLVTNFSDLDFAKQLAISASNYAAKQFGQCLISIIDLQLSYADYILNNKYNYLHIKQEIDAARKQGKKIVFANGCFDVLHVGHIAYLDLARQRGDKLFVAINSDCSIKRLKGDTRPVNDLSDRLLVLSALESTDWIVPFFTDTPEDFLKWLKPDLLVKGGDYQPDEIVGHEIVHSYGGKTEIIKHPYNHISSTKILEKESLKES